ncbi:hypothetical protein H4R34_000162 [Dimargaris verticillata]|uniref:Uncharacterized protein n=1 Tax=Dimargaris verticillata TaxID=2761393 RepID=A0A9W8BCB0_9FUNG|nr:hypothetical protein H4R34_000162 [Dimargaris verticillata]
MASTTHWVQGAHIPIQYTPVQRILHACALAVTVLQYGRLLTAVPTAYTLRTLSSLCLAVVALHHMGSLVTFGLLPRLHQPFLIYFTPSAYGCLWLFVWFSPQEATALVNHFASNAAVRQQVWSANPTGWSSWSSRWSVFALWWVLWVIRRHTYGVVFFQRASQCHPWQRWAYRLYCLICPALLVTAWQWYPYLLARWEPPLTWRPLQPSLWHTGLVGGLAGVSHWMWYSFLSFSYRSILWKTYLREGVAIWRSGAQTVVSRLT